MSLATVLQKFERVKETAPGKYVALCTGHADKSPSLTIRETDDGRVLLHCFAGCPVEHVLAGAGLTFIDLFPERPRSDRPRGPSRAQQSEIDLALIVVEIAKTERARGVAHSETDMTTIRKAAELLLTVPSSRRELSAPAYSKIDISGEALKRTADALRDYKPSLSLCDSCGKPFDTNVSLPDSWCCLPCQAGATS